jgi:hypothetical protein
MVEQVGEDAGYAACGKCRATDGMCMISDAMNAIVTPRNASRDVRRVRGRGTGC